MSWAGDHAMPLPGSSNIPTVPQPVLLPAGKVRGVTGRQLSSPRQRRASSPGEAFLWRDQGGIQRKMHLLDRSPCPDLQANAGEHKSSLLNDNCNCQPLALKAHLKHRIKKRRKKFLGTAMKS